jgi:hypothetical protein
VSLDLYFDVVWHTCDPEPRRGWVDRVARANVTYNLAEMLRDVGKQHFAGGFWEELKRREGGPASALLAPARLALEDFEARHGELQKFDSPNGWGDTAWCGSFLREVISACEAHPHATVGSWR